MSNNNKDIDPKFDIPLRSGMWEAIEPQIPTYKKKRKNRILILLSFLVTSVSISLGLNYLVNRNANIAFIEATSPMIKSDVNESFNKDNVKDLVTSNPEVLQNKLLLDGENKEKINTFKSEITKTIVKGNKNSKHSSKKSVISKVNNQAKIITELNDNSEVSSILDGNDEIIKLNFFPARKIKTSIIKLNFEPEILSINKNKLPKISKYQSNYFLDFGFNTFQSKLILSPSLMKLDNGKGKGLYFRFGKEYKKFQLFSGISYNIIKQKTIMPGAYSTKYHQVFQPNFKTSLPSEYSSRVHDTAKLAIPGTSHNFINQNFNLLGLQIGSNIKLLSYRKWSANAGYSFKYQLLTKGNTFFWDSVNSVAVPFVEKDKNIVFRNIFSSNFQAEINYRISNHFGMVFQPYYEIQHSAIINHYYKLKLQNYGAFFALRYYIK